MIYIGGTQTAARDLVVQASLNLLPQHVWSEAENLQHAFLILERYDIELLRRRWRVLAVDNQPEDPPDEMNSELKKRLKDRTERS
jgi:hypothetical protein